MATEGWNERRLVEVIEAALFVGAKPLSSSVVAEAFPDVSNVAFHDAIRRLQARYRSERRPYGIVRRNGGFVLELMEPFRTELVARVRDQNQVKLTRAAIDVLSVVAYRQPIEKLAIDELLGLDTTGTLRQLVRRGLLAIDKADGTAARYVTSQRFLQVFGLDSLADLPAGEDFERI